MSNGYGIDLGTGNLKVYSVSSGEVTNQKNTIAIVNKNEMYAYGDDAYLMYEKAPETIEVSFPIINGVIADFDNMQSMLLRVLENDVKARLKGADIVIAVPTDITEVEKKAFYDLVDGTIVRPRKIYLVEKPIADAIGAGIDIIKSQGTLLVNIGADTTEISIISLGGIMFSKLLPVGGNSFNEAIINNIRKKYNLLIGNKTAEMLKVDLVNFASVRDDSENAFGRDLVTGLPRECEITTELVNDAVSEQMQTVFENIRIILDRTPPEIAADVYHNGIYITGGSASLTGLEFLFKTNLSDNKINVCDYGSMTVTTGLAKIIEDRYYDKYAVGLKQALAEDHFDI